MWMEHKGRVKVQDTVRKTGMGQIMQDPPGHDEELCVYLFLRILFLYFREGRSKGVGRRSESQTDSMLSSETDLGVGPMTLRP